MQTDYKKFDGVNGGVQEVYRFSNGYGASVVCHDFSYGGASGLKELAVVIFGPSGDIYDFKLTYKTPLTDDVIGWLTDSEVTRILSEIEALPDVITVSAVEEHVLLLESATEQAN